MGKAVIHINTKYLSQILKLPEGYTIDSVHASASIFNREGLSLFIDSPEIPEVEELCEYPTMVPNYTRIQEGEDRYRVEITSFRSY